MGSLLAEPEGSEGGMQHCARGDRFLANASNTVYVSKTAVQEAQMRGDQPFDCLQVRLALWRQKYAEPSLLWRWRQLAMERIRLGAVAYTSSTAGVV